MSEELSPESKLYVKEEIEKIRKDLKEEVEKVKSKATKTFSAVVIVVGLLTGLGVYGLAVSYIDKAMEEKIGESTLAEIQGFKKEAKSLCDETRSMRDEIVGIKTNADGIFSELEQKDVESIAKLEKKLLTVEELFEPLKDYKIVEIYHYSQGGPYRVYAAPVHTPGSGWRKSQDPSFYAFIKKTTDK